MKFILSAISTIKLIYNYFQLEKGMNWISTKWSECRERRSFALDGFFPIDRDEPIVDNDR